MDEHVSETHLHVDSQHRPTASQGLTKIHLQRVAAIREEEEEQEQEEE
jgi:hypothetical protein